MTTDLNSFIQKRRPHGASRRAFIRNQLTMSRLPQLDGINNASPAFGEATNLDHRQGKLPFIIELDGVSVDVMQDTVRDPEQRRQLHEQLFHADRIRIDLRNIRDWSRRERHTAILFVEDVCKKRQNATCRFLEVGGDSDDILGASLSLLQSNQHRHDCDRAIGTAVEIAAYTSRDDATLEAACGAIAERLRNVGGPKLRVTTLLRQARVLLRRDESDRQTNPTLKRVHDVLPDAPCAEDAVVPPKWALTQDGITSPIIGDTILVPAPIVISRRLGHVDGGEQSVEIAWLRQGSWQQRIVPRCTVATARTIVGLAGFGLPVTSSNASVLVDYLLDFEVANANAIPESLVTTRMGWIGPAGIQGFLCGGELISDLAGEQQRNQRVAFLGADIGDQQLVDGIHKCGTMTSWRDAIAPLRPFPRARLALYASLATPMLMLLPAPNFVVSFAGPTSQGKTTSLRGAASCWGRPDERSPTAAIGTWDATPVSLERTMAARDCLPTIVDDTMRARRPQDIAQAIYAVTGGRGRARGTTLGLAGSGAWRTVMITSGESPLTSFTEDGGTRARVLETWGSPFGGRTAETAVIVTQLNENILQHYGHAGPLFVAELIAMREDWPGLAEEYRLLRERYQQRAGTNSVAGRMAAHFAVLDLVEQLACIAGILPWTDQQTAAGLWDEITAETSEADRAAVALRHVYGWCQSHESEFLRGTHSTDSAPLHGWAGRWQIGATRGPSLTTGRAPDPDECLAIYPHRLDAVLAERGFEPAAIRRLWGDRGWLRFNDGRSTLRVRTGDGPVEMVAIRRAAIHDIIGGDEGVV